MAALKEVVLMSELLMLSRAQMRRIEAYFPLAHGVPRVDDRRILSGIVFVIRNGLRWRDAPPAYGPHKTRFIRKGHHPLHPGSQIPQQGRQTRQAPLQTAQPHRDHVRPSQGLATGRDTL